MLKVKYIGEQLCIHENQLEQKRKGENALDWRDFREKDELRHVVLLFFSSLLYILGKSEDKERESFRGESLARDVEREGKSKYY